jgi:hypothetical protein
LQRELLERFDGRAFSSARALFARLKKGWTCPMIDLENLWTFVSMSDSEDEPPQRPQLAVASGRRRHLAF